MHRRSPQTETPTCAVGVPALSAARGAPRFAARRGRSARLGGPRRAAPQHIPSVAPRLTRRCSRRARGALLVLLTVLMARSSCCSLGAHCTPLVLFIGCTWHSCVAHTAHSSCCSLGAHGTLVLLTWHTPCVAHWVHIAQPSCCSQVARGTLVLLTLHTPRAAHWLHTAHPSCRPCAAACTHSVPHGPHAAPHFLHPQQRPGAAAAPQCALRSRRAIRRGRGGEGRAGGRRPQRFPGAEAALCGH